MTDLSHLNALELRLSHERGHLAAAKTQRERDLRMVWVFQIEREILHERAFLGMTASDALDMSDEELLAALAA